MAPSGTMRVVVYHQPGDASVLKVEERPIPKRGDGEVLVKQYGTSVNPVDFKMRSSNKESLPKVHFSAEYQSLGMPDLTGLLGVSLRSNAHLHADSRRRYLRDHRGSWLRQQGSQPSCQSEHALPLTVTLPLELCRACCSLRKATESSDSLPGSGCRSRKAHMQSMSVLRKSGLHTAQNRYHCMRLVKSRLYL